MGTNATIDKNETNTKENSKTKNSILANIEKLDELEKTNDIIREEAKSTESTSNNEDVDNDNQVTNNVSNSATEKVEANTTNNFNNYSENTSHKSSNFLIFFIIFLIFFILSYVVYSALNTNIIRGVSILGVDVSNSSKSDASYQLDNYIKSNLPDELLLSYNDFTTSISTSQLDINYNINNLAQSAYNIGRDTNIFTDSITKVSAFFAPLNLNANISLDEEQLIKSLQEISTQLPDALIESSYYIEDNELVVTSGESGNVVDIEKTIKSIKENLNTFTNLNSYITLHTKHQDPMPIDITKIHTEVYKAPIDAYYTENPYSVHPSVNGIDFDITLDEAKSLISSEEKTEYIIPLKNLIPNITTNMIGTEAFPNLLGDFTTKYNHYDTNRTTNVILSTNKINGTVIMPGETFSYNQVVGERTISAGYKNAPMYVAGEVVDGLGGGICQPTSTLYNAVVYANLEIVERSNHQFIPSYVTASRDATVVYGLTDFKFKNNRDYPIKIVASAINGTMHVSIFGLETPDDFEVSILSYQTGSSSTSIYSEAYKILKKDGVEVSRELLSKDRYLK